MHIVLLTTLAALVPVSLTSKHVGATGFFLQDRLGNMSVRPGRSDTAADF